MGEIKREHSYRTTDGKLHSGKNAVEKATDHQKRIDFKKTIKSMIPEVKNIFNLKNLYGDDEDVEPDEEILLDKVNDYMGLDCGNLEEFVETFIDFYTEIPGIAKFFQLIESRFKKFK